MSIRLSLNGTLSNIERDKLWLKTSDQPNSLHRWDGLLWVKSTPTEAGDIGAETPTGAQSKATAALEAAIIHTNEAVELLEDNLGDLAYVDVVEAAMLGQTLIVGGYLNTDLIEAGSIVAGMLAVSELSAISANLGTVTAGSITGITITGSTVRTAATGARIQMHGTTTPYLSTYDANNLRMRLASDRLNFYDEGGRLGGYLMSHVYPGTTNIPAITLEGSNVVEIRSAGASGRTSAIWTDCRSGGNNLCTLSSMDLGANPQQYSILNVRPTEISMFTFGVIHMECRSGRLTLGNNQRFEVVDPFGNEIVSFRGEIGTPNNKSIRLMGLASYTTTTGDANMHITGSYNVTRVTSAMKYKQNVEPLEMAYAEKFLACEPVWYQSKCPADNPLWSTYGYIADEVAKVEPRLVQFGEEGQPEGFNYSRVAALLHVIIKDNRKRIEALEKLVE